MPAPPRHPTPPFNNLHPHDRKNTAVMGISISHMSDQSPGKSSRRTDLLPPLRLYQQHNDLFERTGAGATQTKTSKRGSAVWSGLVPKKLKQQKHRTRHHLQNKRRNFSKTNHTRFIIHESINTYRSGRNRTPCTEGAQNSRRHRGHDSRPRADDPLDHRCTKRDGHRHEREGARGNGRNNQGRNGLHHQEQDERRLRAPAVEAAPNLHPRSARTLEHVPDGPRTRRGSQYLPVLLQMQRFRTHDDAGRAMTTGAETAALAESRKKKRRSRPRGRGSAKKYRALTSNKYADK